MIDLDIIIVNWNAGQQLRNCLQSIVETQRNGIALNRVIVVDNSSEDGSIDGLEDICVPLTVIHNPENRGFGAACNQGAKESDADYLLFLNPDTILFKDSIVKPIVFMEKPENTNIGIVGIQLIDDIGQVTHTCSRFPNSSHFFSKILGMDRLFPSFFSSHFMTEWDHGESLEVAHVIGAFFLLRRILFDAMNGFDERFFVYLEDLDFSFRARQADWHSFYLADVQAYHKGGGTSEQVKATRLFYSLRSRILYGYKHFGWWSATSLMLGTLIIEPLIRIIFVVSRGALLQVQETVKGYIMLWKDIPQLIFRKESD